ncbi:MAG: response regulator [Anaerolineae bacterium]
MSDTPIKILLVEDNPGDARLIREMLAEARDAPFHLEWADRLVSGLELLTVDGTDAVLLDLSLPESQGLDTFLTVRSHAPEAPIIVLTGLGDEALALEAVRKGAQDYLVKGEVDGRLLIRSLRYAIERHRILSRIKQLQELLPMCAWCKKIRNDQNYWEQVENYITQHVGARFTHCVCPDCRQKFREAGA